MRDPLQPHTAFNENDPYQALEDYSTKTKHIEVCFRRLDERIIEFINESEVILGCVAWLTHLDILQALIPKPCSIIIQKEDFLRPDANSLRGEDSKSILKAHYDQLDRPLTSISFPHLVSLGDAPQSGVRCVGSSKRERGSALPGMHNKFIISCALDSEPGRPSKILPQKVWSGSFNFTNNVKPSFENALIIECPKISQAYLKEFEQIYTLSENLNWTARI